VRVGNFLNLGDAEHSPAGETKGKRARSMVVLSGTVITSIAPCGAPEVRIGPPSEEESLCIQVSVQCGFSLFTLLAVLLRDQVP
jgi:hypothetical protein